jgi:hypothetical protein
MQFQQLFNRLQSAQDRIEVAAILVELAERAERNVILQEALKKVELPPPYNILKYTSPSPGGRKKGYWGRVPYTHDFPSINQVQARLEFSKINYSLFGTKGTVERPDGTRIGRVNFIAGELMRSRRVVSEEEKADRQRQKAIERIAQSEHFQ